MTLAAPAGEKHHRDDGGVGGKADSQHVEDRHPESYKVNGPLIGWGDHLWNEKIQGQKAKSLRVSLGSHFN